MVKRIQVAYQFDLDMPEGITVDRIKHEMCLDIAKEISEIIKFEDPIPGYDNENYAKLQATLITMPIEDYRNLCKLLQTLYNTVPQAQTQTVVEAQKILFNN